jgi:hypothetical protein
MGALLQSGEGADVVVRCAGGQELLAHHLVLSAQWQWFRTKHGWARDEARAAAQASSSRGHTGGQQRQVVDVSEHSAATMQLVLQHLYTGRVSLHKEGRGDPFSQLLLLFVAADQFQLSDLRAACLQLAEQHLSTANALAWLVAAHKANQEDLEQAVMRYTIDNIEGVWLARRLAGSGPFAMSWQSR